MMKVENNTAAIGVTIDPLAPLAPFILKSILLESPDEFSDRDVFEFMKIIRTLL